MFLGWDSNVRASAVVRARPARMHAISPRSGVCARSNGPNTLANTLSIWSSGLKYLLRSKYSRIQSKYFPKASIRSKYFSPAYQILWALGHFDLNARQRLCSSGMCTSTGAARLCASRASAACRFRIFDRFCDVRALGPTKCIPTPRALCARRAGLGTQRDIPRHTYVSLSRWLLTVRRALCHFVKLYHSVNRVRSHVIGACVLTLLRAVPRRAGLGMSFRLFVALSLWL